MMKKKRNLNSGYMIMISINLKIILRWQGKCVYVFYYDYLNKHNKVNMKGFRCMYVCMYVCVCVYIYKRGGWGLGGSGKVEAGEKGRKKIKVWIRNQEEDEGEDEDDEKRWGWEM